MQMQHNEAGLDPAELIAAFTKRWQTQPATETIPLTEATGRVLATDQYARFDIPTTRASAMDGIALRSADFANGKPYTANWERGVQWDFADMGDDFDDRFDTVIPVEQARIEHVGEGKQGEGKQGERLQLTVLTDEPIEAGNCIRPRGATVRQGRLILQAGAVLRPTDLAALAVGGIGSIPVLVKPHVTFIPTGSELIPAGQTPMRGQCFDSNSVMARPLLEEMGARVTMHDIVPDTHDALDAAIIEAARTSDLVLVNGGTSKGSEGLNHPLLEERGTLYSHWMASGPGRPLCTGEIDGKPVIIVPGPPLACFNVLQYLVRPVIDHWYGIRQTLDSISVPLASDVKAPAHMMMLKMADIVAHNGELKAAPVPFKKDTVSALTASGYYHSPIGTSLQEAGTRVDIKLLGSKRAFRGKKLV